jgi:hypothetical protein
MHCLRQSLQKWNQEMMGQIFGIEFLGIDVFLHERKAANHLLTDPSFVANPKTKFLY